MASRYLSKDILVGFDNYKVKYNIFYFQICVKVSRKLCFILLQSCTVQSSLISIFRPLINWLQLIKDQVRIQRFRPIGGFAPYFAEEGSPPICLKNNNNIFLFSIFCFQLFIFFNYFVFQYYITYLILSLERKTISLI